MPGGRPKSDEKQRFLAKVKIVESGCHEWQASVNRGGYGKFTFRNVTIPAHRAAYTILVGEIPDGGHILHKCDNRLCVNPDHLFVGTHQTNVADMDKKGRRGTRCPLTAEDAVQIKALLSRGYSQEKVGQIYGVGQTAVSRIKLGVTKIFKESS